MDKAIWLNRKGSIFQIEPDKVIARPRVGWKTFKGMVYQLRLINKRYQKMGIKGKFTIELPIREK